MILPDEMNGWQPVGQPVSIYSPVVNTNSESIVEHVQIFSEIIDTHLCHTQSSSQWR